MTNKNENKKVTRTLTGVVVSDKMNKSAVILVSHRVKHPKYGKFVTRSSKIHAHDEKNQCHVGDTVVIQETRPISKTKRWKLLNIISSAKTVTGVSV